MSKEACISVETALRGGGDKYQETKKRERRMEARRGRVREAVERLLWEKQRRGQERAREREGNSVRVKERAGEIRDLDRSWGTPGKGESPDKPHAEVD